MRSPKQSFQKNFNDEIKKFPTNDPEMLKTANEIGDFKEGKKIKSPIIKRKFYKGENKEATTTGASTGAFMAPLQLKEQFKDIILPTGIIPVVLILDSYRFAKKESLRIYPKNKEKQDPFRHILACALIFKNLGVTGTMALGWMVELMGAAKSSFKGGEFDSGWTMDMKNNKIGVTLGSQNPKLSKEQLSMKVKELVDKGEYYDQQGIKQNTKPISKLNEESVESVGAYETPAMWAKSTKSKDWSARKFMPGAKRVTVKKRCKKFPYCNQGDINALKIYEREEVKDAIESVAKNFGVSESTIKSILEYEFEKMGLIK